MKFSKFKANLSGRVRVEERQNRRYLVSNVIMVVEGVLNNVLYPADELRTFPEAWDGRPLPLSHPVDSNGNLISANSRDVIDAYSVGQVFNVQYNEGTDSKPGTLVGEAWIDSAKLEDLATNKNSKALKLLAKLEADEPIEISTGLFVEEEVKSGVFNGKTYETIARNHRPDHLAILVDEVGACSVEDGCGMMRANKSGITGAISKIVDRAKEFALNAFTDNDLRNALGDALRQKMSNTPGTYSYVRDIGGEAGNRFVVYDAEWINDEGKREDGVFRRNFSLSGDQITLADSQERVVKQTNYVPQAPQAPEGSSPRANAENQIKGEEDQMKIKQLVAAVIACNSNPFGAESEETLMKMSEAQLTPLIEDEKLKANCACEGKGEELAPEAAKAPEGAAPAAPAPVTNADDAPVTMGQLKALLLNTVPEMIEKAVTAQSSATKADKIRSELKANAACQIPDEALDSLDLAALEGVAKGYVMSTDFSGNGGPREGEGLAANAEGAVPDMPEIDWSK